jgi:hypothetical protein
MSESLKTIINCVENDQNNAPIGLETWLLDINTYTGEIERMPIEDVSKTKTFCSFFLEIMKKTNKNL